MTTHSIRRKERKITDPAIIREIIQQNDSAVISMLDGLVPYGVMMNYAPIFDGENIRLIFHGASAGHKIDCLKINSAVSIFINDYEKMKIVNLEPGTCRWTTYYRSVIIAGKARFAQGLEEKRQMTEEFMRHYTDGEIKMNDAVLNAMVIFEVAAEEISGKQNPA